MSDRGLLAVQLAATLVMVGVIWFVQLVHYPQMVFVDRVQFPRYSHVNQFGTSLVVGVPMLVEALSAAAIMVWYPARLTSPALLIATLLLIAIWVSTATLQMPLHRALLEGFDEPTVRRLVYTNWLRTICWTARAGLLSLLWFAELNQSPTTG